MSRERPFELLIEGCQKTSLARSGGVTGKKGIIGSGFQENVSVRAACGSGPLIFAVKGLLTYFNRPLLQAVLTEPAETPSQE